MRGGESDWRVSRWTEPFVMLWFYWAVLRICIVAAFSCAKTEVPLDNLFIALCLYRFQVSSLVELRIKGVSIKWMYCNPNHMRFYMISPYELDCSISIWMLLRTVWITLTQRPNIFLLHVMQQLCQYCFLPLYSIVFVFGQCTTC